MALGIERFKQEIADVTGRRIRTFLKGSYTQIKRDRIHPGGHSRIIR